MSFACYDILKVLALGGDLFIHRCVWNPDCVQATLLDVRDRRVNNVVNEEIDKYLQSQGKPGVINA